MYSKTILFLVGFVTFVECYLDQNGLCTKQEITCSKSCSAVAFCSGSRVMPLLQGCFGATPFCNMGMCSSSYTPNCNQQVNPFFYCPEEDGTYPDPHDCTRFHICLKGIPYSSYCAGSGLIFSTKTYSCVSQTKDIFCSRVNCKSNNTWALYPADSSYAFFCDNTAKPTIVKRCPKNFIYNLEKENCGFKCTRDGLFPSDQSETVGAGDAVFSTSYIECSHLYGDVFLQTMRDCPNDERVKSLFNSLTSQCVQTNYPNYTTPYLIH